MPSIAYRVDPHIVSAAKIFGSRVIRDLALKGFSEYLSEALSPSASFIDSLSPASTVGALFDQVFEAMVATYRSEYVYKNAIANKLFLARHSLQRSRLYSEIRVGNCKADTVILNGTSSVYEIKTELDDLGRLANQMNAYLSVFDNIWVVTNSGMLQAVASMLPDNVGVIELTSQYTLKVIKSAVSNAHNVDPCVIFDMLRGEEYVPIVEGICQHKLDLPNSERYSYCRELFADLSSETAHGLMVETLKERKSYDMMEQALKKIPRSMIGSVLTTPKLSTRDIKKLAEVCKKDVRSILAGSLR